MTRAKHLRIVQNALTKLIPQGWTPEQIAEAVVSRFELSMEMEMEDAETGALPARAAAPPPPDRPAAVRAAPAPPTPAPDAEIYDLDQIRALPLPQLAQPGSSLIHPNSREAQELIKQGPNVLRRPVAPLRPQATAPAPAPDELSPEEEQARLDRLRDFLYERAPETLDVQPEGCTAPIHLMRNIEVHPAQNSGSHCSLIYTMDGMAVAAPSAQNLDASGNILPINATPLDTPVVERFFVTDTRINMAERLGRMVKLAEDIFRPRPERIESRTPRRSGALTFSTRNTHEDADVLPNPITGKMG